MTPEEKQEALTRYRDILLATLDYCIETTQPVEDASFNPVTHYLQLKEQVEVSFQKGRLSWLKQCFRDISEMYRETEDFAFDKYIKDKTGYDSDIFSSFYKRIDKIIERKRIKTENQYRDVLSMIDHLCQQTPVEQQKLDLLSDLLQDFEGKITGTKIPKAKTKSASKIKYSFNLLYESFSPDNKRKLVLTESAAAENAGATQVLIEFGASGGSGVYAANGINLGIKTYWKDNQTIVVETKKDFLVLQKWEQVQNYKDVVKVEYIEK